MPSIYEQSQSFRAALVRRDTATIEYLTAQYKEVYVRVLRALAVINNQISEAQRSGETVSRAWLNKQERYQSFLRQLDSEFRNYANVLQNTVTARQLFEASQGLRDAGILIGGRFDRLPIRTIEMMVSNLREESPLGQLLNSFGEAAGHHVANVLRDAIVLGKNPRAIAGQVRDALGVPLHRALLIARTESVRAYRQASMSRYADAGIKRWRWVASKSIRTCLNCLARDGEIYEVSKPFPAHPACRCTAVPITDSAPVRAETAGQWFAKQSDAVKREMMSGKAFDLYKQGKIKLNDFKGEGRSRKWGAYTYERSVKEILAS